MAGCRAQPQLRERWGVDMGRGGETHTDVEREVEGSFMAAVAALTAVGERVVQRVRGAGGWRD